MDERRGADDGSGADEVIDVREPAAAAPTGDELEDVLTAELERVTGPVPVIDVALDPLAG